MRSLRTRLIVATFCCLTAVLAISGFVVYTLIQGQLYRELEHSLVVEARALTGMVESDGVAVRMEWTEENFQVRGPEPLPKFFHLWSRQGESLNRSVWLKQDLPRFGGTFDDPQFRSVQLLDGRPAYAIGVSFQPRSGATSGTIHIDDVPAAVTDAVHRSFKGIQLGKVVLIELKDGEPVYELLGTTKERQIELSVTAAGKILEIDKPEPAEWEKANQSAVSPTPSSNGESPGLGKVDLVIARDATSLMTTLASLKQVLFTVWGIATAISLLGIAFLVPRTLGPLDELRRQLQGLDITKLNQSVLMPDPPSEILPVVEQLNELMARLSSSYEREKAFTSNAAHELRTPLAGLRVTLELALSKQRDTKAYRQAIEQCLSICHDMEPLVEKLLILSRAGSEKLVRKDSDIDLCTELKKWWQPFDALAANRDLRIVWALTPGLTVRSDSEMLRMVISNLLENATNYAIKGSDITVEARQFSDDSDMLEIAISNPTEMSSSLDVPHLFEPFWRSEASRSVTGPHAGLGLSICKQLVEILEGNIRAFISEDDSFTVSIALPYVAGSSRLSSSHAA